MRRRLQTFWANNTFEPLGRGALLLAARLVGGVLSASGAACQVTFRNLLRLSDHLRGWAPAGIGLILCGHGPNHADRLVTWILSFDRNDQTRLGLPQAMTTSTILPTFTAFPLPECRDACPPR